ncbi:MAG: hypothetical protein QOH51_3429 [Acidobacteriota bacterium]|nr:hypothetical protein [Acidobacteriota bacterium]
MPDLTRRGVRVRHLGSAAEEWERFVGSIHVGEGDSVPVDHLDVVGHELFGSAVFAQRAFVIFALDGGVARVHVVVGAPKADEPAEFFERFKAIVNSEVEDSVGPRLAG